MPLAGGKIVNGCNGKVTGFKDMRTPTITAHIKGLHNRLRCDRKPSVEELMGYAAKVYGVQGVIDYATVWKVPYALFTDPDSNGTRSAPLLLEVCEVFTQVPFEQQHATAIL
jgi:hypothetical protein